MKEYAAQIILGGVGVIVAGSLGALGLSLSRFVKRFGAVPDTMDRLLSINEAQTGTIAVMMNVQGHLIRATRDQCYALKKIGCNGDTDKALKHAAEAEDLINSHRDERVKGAMTIEAVG